MENVKTTLDREPISSEDIRSRQDLNQVLKGHQALKPPLWKSVWFYGPVGIAAVTLIVATSNMNPDAETNVTVLGQSIDKSEQFQLAQTQFFSESNEELVSKKNVNEEQAITPEPSIPNEDQSASEIERTTIVLREQDPTPPEEVNTPVDVTEAPSDALVPPDDIPEVKRMKTMPTVGGIFTGRIRVDELCLAGKIACNNDYVVYSYDVQYSNGREDIIERVRGNKFPPYMCSNVKDYNIGQPIFITNILAKNPEGDVLRLLSMRLSPTF
ncbi:MAG: hypothetical protein ACI837_003149 [Crocinitomicaceae bacterium]|jgi:hypothetical protein